ncbi:hypothetical protein HY489_00220 [Candidatus Woesearchaeota archaeon]|nr:hypothetical protein [Candidatus Woesearchaeota archaeon]
MDVEQSLDVLAGQYPGVCLAELHEGDIIYRGVTREGRLAYHIDNPYVCAGLGEVPALQTLGSKLSEVLESNDLAVRGMFARAPVATLGQLGKARVLDFSVPVKLGYGASVEKATLAQLALQRRNKSFLCHGTMTGALDGIEDLSASFNIVEVDGRFWIFDAENPGFEGEGITLPYIAPIDRYDDVSGELVVDPSRADGRVYTVK